MVKFIKIARIMLAIFFVVFLAAGLYGLVKNRAEGCDYIYYCVFFAIGLCALAGGVVLGLLTTLVAVFAYVSFSIMQAVFFGEAVYFNLEHLWWVTLFILAGFTAGQAGDKLKHVSKVFKKHGEEIEELMVAGRASLFSSLSRFRGDIEYEISRAKRSQSLFLVFYIELINLEDVMKRFGKDGQHKIMDQVGIVLLRIFRDTDKKAKVDENTYGVLMPETPAASAEVITKKIMGALKAVKIDYKGELIKYAPLIKVGYASFPKDGNNLAGLEEKARAGMLEIVGI
ncbi:MAG: diguanylate cyclase [Candidatus Omnitrophota bacterium]